MKNDMDVRLYIEVKRSEPNFAMYPLCIDTTDKIGSEIHNFDRTCGEIMCGRYNKGYISFCNG